jgi:hypothetical protein
MRRLVCWLFGHQFGVWPEEDEQRCRSRGIVQHWS